MRIDRHVHSVLLDSGSEATIIPVAIAANYDMRPTTVRLRAANLSGIQVLGEVTISAFIDDLPIEVVGIVSPQVHEIILGLPSLRQNQIQRDYSADHVTVRGVTVPLHTRASQGWCRRIVLTTDTELQPQTEYVVPANVHFMGPVPKCAGTWLNEKAEPIPGVCVCCSFSTAKQDV